MHRTKRGKKTRRARRRQSRHRRIFPGRQRGGSNPITRTVIQTSKDPIPEYVVTMLKKYLKGWEYRFFTDADILAFFQDNPRPEFPDITAKFNSFASGPHRADLFRYYYLYLRGGLFIDSDLMLYDDLETIVGKADFVSVWALRPAESAFNGFLGTAPGGQIIHAALKDMYAMTNEQLQADYTLACKNLGGFIQGNAGPGVKMLKELMNNDTFCTIEDPDSKKISLVHYQSVPIPEGPLHI